MSENYLDYDIQPKASILNVFSRLSYKSWYAIAEFVDNSTQSYLSHKKELENLKDFSHLTVEVNYDKEKNTLTIVDNAYGMEIERFLDAITLDAKNEDQTGRNEFGMGLKTAASWFGDKWSVRSTQLGSANEYYAVIDIPKLKQEDINTTQVFKEKTNKDKHGTTILIENLTKKLSGPQTISKIRKILSSMYRRDIVNHGIEIIFNGEKIAYQEIKVLYFRGTTWKRDVEFDFSFDGKEYHVSGFVGIMDSGSYPASGFALFRNDRVIIGGEDQNYKPLEIFVQRQSQISLKLFGELSVDDFPVNQAKDGFIWDDGLEYEFIQALKSNIADYIEIARLSKKERAKEEELDRETSENVRKEVNKGIDNLTKEVQDGFDDSYDEETEDLKKFREKLSAEEESEEEIYSEEREYEIPVDKINKKRVSVKWEIASSKKWITKMEENGILYINININHPFFKPYSKEFDFKIVLEKLVIAFVIAEEQAKTISDEKGMIPASAIRSQMNEILPRICGE